VNVLTCQFVLIRVRTTYGLSSDGFAFMQSVSLHLGQQDFQRGHFWRHSLRGSAFGLIRATESERHTEREYTVSFPFTMIFPTVFYPMVPPLFSAALGPRSRRLLRREMVIHYRPGKHMAVAIRGFI